MKNLFAIEGGDGCGKSTQVELVSSTLREWGYTVFTYSFPSKVNWYANEVKSIVGRSLSGDENINPELLYLLLASDRYALRDNLILWSCEHDFVILDRYTMSGIVYGMLNGLPKEWCATIESRLPKAHNIFIKLDPRIAFERKVQSSESVYDRSLDMQKRIYQYYCEIIPEAYHVDGSKSKADVANQIINLILKTNEEPV